MVMVVAFSEGNACVSDICIEAKQCLYTVASRELPVQTCVQSTHNPLNQILVSSLDPANLRLEGRNRLTIQAGKVDRHDWAVLQTFQKGRQSHESTTSSWECYGQAAAHTACFRLTWFCVWTSCRPSSYSVCPWPHCPEGTCP